MSTTKFTVADIALIKQELLDESREDALRTATKFCKYFDTEVRRLVKQAIANDEKQICVCKFMSTSDYNFCGGYVSYKKNCPYVPALYKKIKDHLSYGYPGFKFIFDDRLGFTMSWD